MCFFVPGQLDDDPAPEGVAHEDSLSDTEGLHEVTEEVRVLAHVPGISGFRRPAEARKVKADEADPVGDAGLNIVIYPEICPPALQENRSRLRILRSCHRIGNGKTVHFNRHE